MIDYPILVGVLAWAVCVLAVVVIAQRTKIRKLKAAIRMDGAPDAPCAECCWHGPENCSRCGCECHRIRSEYVSRQFAEALR